MYHFKVGCLEIVYFIVNPNTSPKDVEIWSEDSGEPVLYVLAQWGQEIPGSGWEIPQCFNKYPGIHSGGSSSIPNIQNPISGDKTGNFFLGETASSYIFSDDLDFLSLDKCYVFNTEGHLLSIWTSA